MGSHTVAPYWHTLRDPLSSYQPFPSTIFMDSAGSRTAAGTIPGVTVGGNDKKRFVDTFCDMLDAGRVVLMDPQQFFVTNINGPSSYEQIISETRNQLLSFSREVKPPTDPVHGKVHVEYSGKSGGRQDDLVMTILLGAYHATWFLFDDQWFRLVPGLTKTLMIG